MSKHNRTQRILHRALALLLGLAPFVVAECTLRWWDIPAFSPAQDPFVGFTSSEPLFNLRDDGSRYVTNTAREPFFRPESFAAHKEADEFRIFCLGGSTVQGRPYAIETAFTTWLELSLQVAAPARRWEVINCGGVSYASYRLANLLPEILQYQPDLIIVLTGHNEFLEDRTYEQIKTIPSWVARPISAFMRLKLSLSAAQLVRHYAHGQVDPPINTLASEVDAMLDYENGLRFYHRDPIWRNGVIRHFRYSLERICRLTSDAHVRLLLLNPTCNLRDCPPFKSEYDPQVSRASQDTIGQLRETAASLPVAQTPDRIALLLDACRLDPSYAGLQFDLAKNYEALGLYAEAEQHFRLACYEDICPLRILEEQRHIIRETGEHWSVPVLDLYPLFAKPSVGAIPGNEVFLDHVHPTISAHQQIADTILNWMIDSATLTIENPPWREEREQRYRDHRDTLDASYFTRGKERLEGLRRWSQGRGVKARSSGFKVQSSKLKVES